MTDAEERKEETEEGPIFFIPQLIEIGPSTAIMEEYQQ